MSSSLKVSNAGLEEIVEHEGEILRVYKDPIGLPTLGVGHLLTPAERREMPVGTKITKAQSRAYLRKDLARFERCVNEAVKVQINQNQFDALVSLAFNIGEANFEGSSVVRLLNQKNYLDAANAFLRWNKAKENGVLTVLPGLTTRRKKERALFLKPPQPANDQVTDSRLSTRPEPVPGDVKGVPNPVSTSPTDPATKGPNGGIGSVLDGTADVVTGALNKAGNIQEGVSRVPFLAKFGRWFLTAFSLVTTFIYANWELFLLALLITAVIAWYLLVVRPKRLAKLDGD